VPVATAVPEVIAFAVITPDAADPKAVEPNVRVASSVLPESAVFAFTGCVPEKIWIVPLLSSGASAFASAFAATSERLTTVLMVCLLTLRRAGRVLKPAGKRPSPAAT